MIERRARFWQQFSTALFTFAGSLIASGFVLTRIEKPVEGWSIFGVGVSLFLIAFVALRRSLGPKNERWTLSQSVVFLATGKLYEIAEAHLMLQFENPPTENWSQEIKEKTLEKIWKEAATGELWLDAIELNPLNAQRLTGPERISPSWLAAYRIQLRDDNSLALMHPVNSNRDGLFVGVVFPADQIRALRRKKFLK